MTYLLWVALGCGLFLMIRMGTEVRANYMRRERAKKNLEKLDSALE